MKKWITGVLVASLGVAMIPALVASEKKQMSDEEKNALANPEKGLCPVSGKKIDGLTFSTLDGDKYGFCCKGCVRKFQKDPAKYIQEKDKKKD